MEFKKKTIIWEDNNEPPKDYIWAKNDGKFYEYNYATRSWVESESISGESEDSDSGEITEDDLVKYYTKGKYSKLEDVPVLQLSNLVENGAILSSYNVPSLYFKISDIAEPQESYNDIYSRAQEEPQYIRIAIDNIIKNGIYKIQQTEREVFEVTDINSIIKIIISTAYEEEARVDSIEINPNSN